MAKCLPYSTLRCVCAQLIYEKTNLSKAEMIVLLHRYRLRLVPYLSEATLGRASLMSSFFVTIHRRRSKFIPTFKRESFCLSQKVNHVRITIIM